MGMSRISSPCPHAAPACHGPPSTFRPPGAPSGTQGSHYQEGGCSPVPCPGPFSRGTVPPTCSIPQEPLSYATVHNKYLTKLSPLAPIAPGQFGEGVAAPRRSRHPPHRSPLDFPGWWAQAPIAWAPRSVEGIQIPPPSGFSTNNHPTRLWRIDEPLT